MSGHRRSHLLQAVSAVTATPAASTCDFAQQNLGLVSLGSESWPAGLPLGDTASLRLSGFQGLGAAQRLRAADTCTYPMARCSPSLVVLHLHSLQGVASLDGKGGL